MKTIISVAILAALLSGCTKNPSLIQKLNSEFSITDTLVQVNENVSLSNLGDSVLVTYMWDFGDGTSSSERTPVHSYPTPGNYNIKLVISDDNGSADSITHSLKVGERFVYGILVSSYNTNRWMPDYGLWDSDSTGINARPDLFISISETGNSPLFQSATVFNIDKIKLPLYFEVPDIKINPINYIGLGSTEIALKDRDGLSFETMVTNQLSGVSSSYSTYDKTSHTGEFSFGFDSNSLIVRYKIK